MTNWTLHPRGLDGSDVADGHYAVSVVAGKVTGWIEIPGNTIASVVAGNGIDVDNTDPENPIISAVVVALRTTEIAGGPALVWDDNNELVYTEETP